MAKLILKENGEKTKQLIEGNLEEIKEYLSIELDDLVDWLDEPDNNWENFEGMKKELKENIKQAESPENIEEAFEYINNQMSWWGIFIEE